MVSVVIPTYNREKTINRSLQSVINQSYDNIEIIIVDDGSTDSTKQMVLRFKDPRIKVIETSHRGACHARNVGILNSRGDYIAFQDSDDVWELDKLRLQVECIRKTNADIVFCKLKKIKDGQIEAYWPERIKEGFVDKGESLLGIGTQSLLCRKDSILQLMFDEEMPRFQELEMLIRATKKDMRIYCLDAALVNYYVGSDSISSNLNKRIMAYELLLRKHPDIKTISPQMCKTISNSLLITASAQKKNKVSYSETIRLAKYYKMTIMLYIKLTLIYLGLY